MFPSFSRYDSDQATRLSKPAILQCPTTWMIMNLSSEQSMKCGKHKCKHCNWKMAPKEFLAPSTASVASVRTVEVILQGLVEPQNLHQLVNIKELKLHYLYMFLTEL